MGDKMDVQIKKNKKTKKKERREGMKKEMDTVGGEPFRAKHKKIGNALIITLED